MTDLGRAQARAVGRFLAESIAGELGCELYLSPLGRAVATAEIVREQMSLSRERMRRAPLLAEADHGEWEGLTEQQIRASYPQQIAARNADRWNYRIPGGESYADVAARAERWLRSMRGVRLAVVVTHAMTSRCIRGCFLDLSPMDCMRLDHSQDTVYVLTGQSIEAFRCPVDVEPRLDPL